mmetsp:Transcript_12514/g.24006  ORF Transcript_12514/g.24006 Transcript_12514/m.24006 type:complete len:289 (+) Transcript_12514:217-1083(+)
MVHGVLGGDAVLGIVFQKCFEQMQSIGIQVIGDSRGERSLEPLGESRIPIRQLRDTRPYVFAGGSQLTENLVELVNFGITREQRTLGDHLHENSSDSPNIDGRSIGLLSEQDFGRTVPERDNFVRQGTNRRAKRTRESKVRKLELSVPGHQQVLRLEVTMHDTSSVTKGKSTCHLEKIRLDQCRGHHSRTGFHVLFQVLIEEFKHQVELAVFLNTVLQVDNVAVSQFAQQTNFTKSRGRNSFVFDFQTNTLEGDNLVRVAITGLVDDSVRSFTEVGTRLFNLLVSFHC